MKPFIWVLAAALSAYACHFAVLHGTPLRATFVDALGNHVDGGELPDTASVEWAFDFVYDGPRLAIANMLYEGWGYEVVVDLFAPHRRAK